MDYAKMLIPIEKCFIANDCAKCFCSCDFLCVSQGSQTVGFCAEQYNL
uniref:Uncharacterized protein n=1 Tax=Anguilla anguilla TaxID=7936 RepID=A0A0E9R803_ANGAN